MYINYATGNISSLNLYKNKNLIPIILQPYHTSRITLETNPLRNSLSSALHMIELMAAAKWQQINHKMLIRYLYQDSGR